MTQLTMRDLSLARTTTVRMVEDLLAAGHLGLSKDGDRPHPCMFFQLEGEPTDKMPITHEQHKALHVLLNQFKKDKHEENPNRD